MKISEILSNESLSPSYIFCLNGNGEVMICGCLCVLEYTECKIKLKLKKNNLTICGDKLSVFSYKPDIMQIRGAVKHIEIEERGRAN